jgi:hypothetical protein
MGSLVLFGWGSCVVFLMWIYPWGSGEIRMVVETRISPFSSGFTHGYYGKILFQGDNKFARDIQCNSLITNNLSYWLVR